MKIMDFIKTPEGIKVLNGGDEPIVIENCHAYSNVHRTIFDNPTYVTIDSCSSFITHVGESALPSNEVRVHFERCPNCGSKVFDEDRTCQQCGAPA